MTTFRAFLASTSLSSPRANAEELTRDVEPDYAQLTDIAWRTLRRLGVAESLLADATQDALLVVHRRYQVFRGESSFSTWFYGVLLRVASSYRRSARRADGVFDRRADIAEEHTVGRQPSPLEELERRAAASLLNALLDELPMDVREVFVMVELEELPIAEAARAIGVSSSTCKSRLRTARAAFNAAVARQRARRVRQEWAK